jgi:hypothetical protein
MESGGNAQLQFSQVGLSSSMTFAFRTTWREPQYAAAPAADGANLRSETDDSCSLPNRRRACRHRASMFRGNARAPHGRAIPAGVAGTLVLRHPRASEVQVEYATFQPDDTPDLRLVMYAPAGSDC